MTATVPGAWDGYLVGPENGLAEAAVRALARGEEGFSPLVIHGPSGAGKTRLLAGLVAERVTRNPGASVALMTAEAFAAECAAAARMPGGWAELRGRFRALDLLALDDLHALERAPMAREELEHTLDALDEGGGRVAVTAKVGPGQWSGWPARLVSRLVGGLAVRVDPPGPEARRRYLLDRARARGLRLAAETIEAAAESADGYRALDGALARLVLSAKLSGGRAPGAEALVDEDGAAPDGRAELDRIARAVAARFGVPLRGLRSASRRPTLVAPRHLAIYLGRARTGLSFAALGAYFGGRDPATIRHACRAAERRLAEDPALAAAVEALRG